MVGNSFPPSSLDGAEYPYIVVGKPLASLRGVAELSYCGWETTSRINVGCGRTSYCGWETTSNIFMECECTHILWLGSHLHHLLGVVTEPLHCGWGSLPSVSRAVAKPYNHGWEIISIISMDVTAYPSSSTHGIWLDPHPEETFPTSFILCLDHSVVGK